MALTDFHVNGPAAIQVALSGSSYTPLGYTEDGVDISIRIFHEDINTDYYGPQQANDVQYMGSEATISLPMIVWDTSTMNSLLGQNRGLTQGRPALANIGTLMYTGQKHVGLRITASQRSGLVAEQGFEFPYSFLVNEVPLKVGTRVTRMRLNFRSLAINGELYNRI